MLISVVTPSYNQASYLELTIRSVLAQSDALPPGIELEYLIVDGGSTDGSVEIIQRYAHRLAWWVSERDSGQAEAINKGLARAHGEVVAWLNSDDLYLPGAVGLAAFAMQSNPQAGLVFGDAITIGAKGRPLNMLAFGDWGLPELMRFRIICQPAVFMRRSVLEKAGYLDPTYHFMLDHQLWLRMARLAPIQHIGDGSRPWAAARHHSQAKNVNQPAGFSEESFRVLNWLKQQPDLAPLVQQDRRWVEAGAYRLIARYFLDGEFPARALRAYGQALARDPRYALKHWHRMLYAVFCLVGGKGLASWYYRARRSRLPDLAGVPGLESWPGISLQK